MKLELKVKAHRSNVTHWGHGSSPRNYTALCGAGSVSTGSRSRSQFLRSPITDDVNCKNCAKLAEAPAAVDGPADQPETPGLTALSQSLAGMLPDFAW